MAKDLHHSCQSEDIIQDLKNQGLIVTNAFNKLKFKAKEPLNMFTLCFDSNEDVKKIYDIKTILNTVVKIEQFKTTNIIPQSKSCQGFMHTKNYCCKPPKCATAAKTIQQATGDVKLQKVCKRFATKSKKKTVV